MREIIHVCEYYTNKDKIYIMCDKKDNNTNSTEKRDKKDRKKL